MIRRGNRAAGGLKKITRAYFVIRDTADLNKRREGLVFFGTFLPVYKVCREGFSAKIIPMKQDFFVDSFSDPAPSRPDRVPTVLPL